jgi:hypothetical protein
MAGEKSTIRFSDDSKGIGIPSLTSQAAYARHPSTTHRGKACRLLSRLTLLSIFLFAFYIWNSGRFKRFSGEGKDLWILDAFVSQGHDKHDKGHCGPLLGKAAEELFL